MNKLNVPTRFEDGLRVTDAQTLDIVRMVLLGQVNSGLVLTASQMDGNAIGLSGTDGNMIRARIIDERLGFVGEIESVDPTLVQTLIEQGYIPVIAPLGASESGTCLNINADLVAAHLAGALNVGIKREELIEVLMQTSCYAGVPAAVQALNAAADILQPKG
jgi:acetylglutamate kinase